MKKLVSLSLILLFPTFLFSQGGPKWSESGNAISSSSFLGSTNAQSLFFKTNNQTRFYISATGDVVMPLLGGTSNALAVLDNSGKVIRINFSGSSTEVLFGNGTFGSLSTATGWFTSAGVTYTTKNVGIGVPSPSEALEVNGNAIINGDITAEKIQVADIIDSKRGLLFKTTSMCMEGYDPIEGTRNEICAKSADFFINSNPSFNFNTILNSGNTGNVGVGTNSPLAKMHISGSFRVDGETFYSGTSHFSRISPMPGDTVIQFGDSTLLLNPSTNTIYVKTPYPAGSTKGVGIGSYASVGKGLFSTALGHQSRAMGDYSHTIGYFVRANANNSMVIGSGLAGNYLENNIANSLMVGFNSNIPTLFVSGAGGPGNFGFVSIGTTCINPNYRLGVNGKIVCTGLDIKIPDASTCWPDNVFESSYKRKNYLEKELFVTKNKHLEGIQSAKDIEDNGLQLENTLTGIVRNTEENTLDIIELYKIVVAQAEEIKELKELLNKK